MSRGKCLDVGDMVASVDKQPLNDGEALFSVDCILVVIICSSVSNTHIRVDVSRAAYLSHQHRMCSLTNGLPFRE